MTATICNAISATKANRLYWLGRYAERVYLSLHLLLKFYEQKYKPLLYSYLHT